MDIIHACERSSMISIMNANSLYDYACCGKIGISFSKDPIFLIGNENILHEQLSSRSDQYDEGVISIGIL